MTKQEREELVKQMENDYEELSLLSSSLDDFIGNLIQSERKLPSNLESHLTHAHNIIEACVSTLYSLIPDPEDS